MGCGSLKQPMYEARRDYRSLASVYRKQELCVCVHLYIYIYIYMYIIYIYIHVYMYIYIYVGVQPSNSLLHDFSLINLLNLTLLHNLKIASP